MLGIFDPEITAKPCRAGCMAHVHADDLRSQVDAPEPEHVIPPGWTAQTVARPGQTLYVCNGCEDEVWEADVPTHVCKDWT